MATDPECTRMKSGIPAAALTALLIASAVVSGAKAASPLTDVGKQQSRGPHWFLHQLEYEHAYPEAPTHPYVRTIARAKSYKAFHDVRDLDEGHGRSGRWHSVGPSTVLNPVDPAISDAPLWKNLSGRATALAIGRTCTDTKCRLWLGTAGGGLWRTDEALEDEGDWDYITLPEAHNTIGSIALDPNDSDDDTVLVRCRLDGRRLDCHQP